MMICMSKFTESMRELGYCVSDNDTIYESSLYLTLAMAKRIQELEYKLNKLERENMTVTSIEAIRLERSIQAIEQHLKSIEQAVMAQAALLDSTSTALEALTNIASEHAKKLNTVVDVMNNIMSNQNNINRRIMQLENAEGSVDDESERVT